MYNYATDSLS